MIEITQSDLEKLLQMFNQLAEDSQQAYINTEGDYLAGYYSGTCNTAMMTSLVLQVILSEGKIPDNLPIIDNN